MRATVVVHMYVLTVLHVFIVWNY